MAASSSRPSSSPSPPADVRSIAPLHLGAGPEDPDARPARAQMLAALFLGLALVAVPLYLRRRPHEDHTINEIAEPGASMSGAQVVVSPGSPPVGPPLAAITLSESRVLECHDPGPKKTSAEQCDHLVQIEQAFSKAVTDAATCVPASTGGGSLVFVADVSFGRKRNPILVTLPRDGRNLRSPHGARGHETSSLKIINACTAAVKHTLLSAIGASLSTAPHAHARYKIAISASYPTPLSPALEASPYP
jgi:hypothetical protein